MFVRYWLRWGMDHRKRKSLFAYWILLDWCTWVFWCWRGSSKKKRKRSNYFCLELLELESSTNYNYLEFICFYFANKGPRNLNTNTNKNGKCIVGDEEEIEDIQEEESLIEDKDDLSDVDVGEE